MEKKKSWFLQLLSYASDQKGKFVLSILLSIISISVGLIPYFCVYQILVIYLKSNVIFHDVWMWGLLAIACYLVKVLFFGLSTGISHSVAYQVVAGLREKMCDKFLHVPLGEMHQYSIGEIKNIIVDKIEQIESPLAHVVPEGAGHVILPLVSILALGMIDYRIALASLITLPGSIVCMGLTFQISGKNFEKYNTSNAHMSSMIVEYIEGIEVIKAFGRAGGSYDKYAHAICDYRTFVIRWLESTWVTMKLAFALFPTTLLGTLPMSLYLAYYGHISDAQAALAVMLSMSMVTSLGKLEVFFESIRQVKETVEELETYLQLKELLEPNNTVEISNHSVVFDDVHFSYHDDVAQEEVLHGISMNLPQGSFTALVGPSGSGKSTIAKLLARFWDVQKGSIRIGDCDIKEMSLSQLSNYVSFVTQDNFLFQCSLLENIRMGNPNASDEEVKAAARAAQCEEFILKLEDGYDTSAGEAGKRLSGGEKQRIAIARMMLKNAPIVILDEATAFTDPENEDKIQQSIAKLAKGKTLLVIAHRLSTIRHADSIVVLQDGNIEAKGTHEQLLATCPLYQTMWEAHIGAKQWAVSVENKEQSEVSVHVS